MPSASPSRHLRWLLKPRNLGMAAGLLLLVVSIVLSVRLGVALAQERALRGEFAELVGQQEIVLEVVDSRSTVRRLLLPPTGASTSSPYGKLYTRTDMEHVVAMAGRLPPPAPGQAYHLWVTTGERLELAGILGVNEDGFGLLVLEADVIGPVYESAFVTLQPVSSPTPSEQVVLRWEGSQ